jgi:hypothetical protein
MENKGNFDNLIQTLQTNVSGIQSTNNCVFGLTYILIYISNVL